MGAARGAAPSALESPSGGQHHPGRCRFQGEHGRRRVGAGRPTADERQPRAHLGAANAHFAPRHWHRDLLADQAPRHRVAVPVDLDGAAVADNASVSSCPVRPACISRSGAPRRTSRGAAYTSPPLKLEMDSWTARRRDGSHSGGSAIARIQACVRQALS